MALPFGCPDDLFIASVAILCDHGLTSLVQDHLLHSLEEALKTNILLESSKQIDGSFNVQAYSLEVYGRGPAPAPPPPDFSRSYTSSYPSSSVAVGSGGYDYRFNKGKDLATVSPPTARKNGKWLNDPEFQRKRRVASYKAYSVEGKVKVSIRRSFRWLKNKYTKVIYGWW